MPSGSGSYGADDDGLRVLRRGGQRGDVLDGAEHVRLLDEDRAGVVVDRRCPGVGVGHAAAERDLDDLGAEAARERAQRLAAVRVQAARDDELAAAVGELRQVGGGADGARALVDRGVGDRQPGELADRGLVLEHHLQAALADLRLVRRVGRQELRAAEQHVDHGGDVVVVHPGAEEGDLVLGRGVAARQVEQVAVDVLLGHPGGQVELLAQPHAVGDLVEELVDGRDADGGQHRVEVGGGDSGVPAHLVLWVGNTAASQW